MEVDAVRVGFRLFGHSFPVILILADAGRYGSSTVPGTAAKRGQSLPKGCPYHLRRVIVALESPPNQSLHPTSAAFVAARLEALICYRFDGFLTFPGAPDPPPRENTRLRRDREFNDSLGPERPVVPCRIPDCARGSRDVSSFCIVHHFEKEHG